MSAAHAQRWQVKPTQKRPCARPLCASPFSDRSVDIMTVQTATRQEVQHKLRASVMQQDLDRALKAHAGSTSADKFLPILATIHIQTRADHLILTSTNMELAQMTRVPASSKWPDNTGAVCVDYKNRKENGAASEPGRIDLDYVPEYRSLVASPLEHAKPHLRVRCARDQAHLKARPASDFPAVTKAAPDGVLEKITLKEFKARVKPIGSVKKRSGTF